MRKKLICVKITLVYLEFSFNSFSILKFDWNPINWKLSKISEISEFINSSINSSLEINMIMMLSCTFLIFLFLT